jgi:uracil-DNA glycosylase
VFEKLQKAAIGVVMSVHPSPRTEKLSSIWTDFRELFSKIRSENPNSIKV